MARQLTFAHQTDIGQIRENNQDAVYGFVAPPSEKNPNSNFGLFIVADGMGEGDYGAKAAALTVETISQYVMDNLYPQWVEGILPDDNAATLEILRQAMLSAHKKVADDVGSGFSTVSSVLIANNLMCVAHVGETRAYLISDEFGEVKIRQLTENYWVFKREIGLGYSEYNFFPLRMLGGHEELEIFTHVKNLDRHDDYILLCSDGLWKTATEFTFLDTIYHQKSYRFDVVPTIDLQAICDELVVFANVPSSRDNISVILVRIE